ncbi:hypothetical protein [Bacillus luti]|uniref:hypothetical protein n=1 Tax=Bacillus luti TaxID=2026191 RepID=UPI00289EDC73|nr:hypothetical protein [Bacillus luti]
MNISRLKKTEQALVQAYERLKICIDNRDEDGIYAALGEVLLWINVTHDWHKKNNGKYVHRLNINQKKNLILGIRFAYNLVKHNLDFIVLHQEDGGFSFPMEFSIEIPELKIVWTQASDIPVNNSEFKGQRNHYISHLQGEKVLDTVNEVFDYLMSENAICYATKSI